MMPGIFRAGTTYHWTHHSRAKMRHYGLSEQRVRRVLHAPRRIEEGVAPKTIAMMQPSSVRLQRTIEGGPSSREAWNQEIWVMVEKKKRHGSGVRRQEVIKIISAWRYPGVSKPRDAATSTAIRSAYQEYLAAL